MRVRSFIGLVMAALILGCAGTSPVASPTTQPTITPTPPGSAAAETPFPADPEAAPDEALVARLMAEEGLEEEEAVFVALTKVGFEEIAPLTYRVTHFYPTGNTTDMTVTITPDVTRDPDAAPAIVANYQEVDGVFHFQLSYFIPYEELPDDVEQQIRPQARLALSGALLAGQMTTGIDVDVSGTVNKMALKQAGKLLSKLDDRMGTGGKLSNLYKALQLELSVRDALAMREEHDSFMKRLDELEECVRNPTNPVTKQRYADDPAEQQRVLKVIEDARVEIRSNIAVIYVGMINGISSNFIPSSVPYVSKLVSKGTAWSKETLRTLNEELIEQVAREVTPCEDEWEFTMTITYGSGANGMEVIWTGALQIAAPVEGRAARAITGAGVVSGEFHSPTCTVPTEDGGSKTTTGDFSFVATGEFAIGGEALIEVTNRGPILFAYPVPTIIEETFVPPESPDGCFELAFFGAPMVGGTMMDPNSMANKAIKIAATGSETVTEQIQMQFVAGEDSGSVPMTRTVTLTRKE